MLSDKQVLITGGTGSLGKVLVRRLLAGDAGIPRKIVVLSRDEAKQHQMRVDYMKLRAVTDEVIYHNFEQLLDFRIGDVRDYASLAGELRNTDVVLNAAALKQVPTCEYFPYEAVRTNISGPENISRAIRELGLPVETVVGISTDKACKPVNVMGMTKAIQERVVVRGNLECPSTRFICVRYGNVLASRGSVIPLFREQIAKGGPVTITTTDMTRFLLSLNEAVDLIFDAIRSAKRGQTFIPVAPAAKVTDIAAAMIGDAPVDMTVTGIRPGEKIHEILVSEEECHRTYFNGKNYVIDPILPELRTDEPKGETLKTEYSSMDDNLDQDGVRALLNSHGLLEANPELVGNELLR